MFGTLGRTCTRPTRIEGRGMPIKSLYAKWPGTCHYCAGKFEAGAVVKWDTSTKAVYHQKCYTAMVNQAADDAAVKAQAGQFIAQQMQQEAAEAMAKQTAGKAGGPRTQKARGIKALQQHGILAESFATIALTEDQAIADAAVRGFPCFVRPCPITPRHGFVDSRVVKTGEEVRGVWAEARAADPEAELIVMPFIEAEHNMVWRPGLHGATAGIDSISVLLQPQYSTGSGTWQTIAKDAGVDLDKADPYIEAVAAVGYETVVTQVRAGVKVVPTDANWNPEEGFVVAKVITLTKADKEVPGKMLAWEQEACEVEHGTVIYTPGDNLGSHWAVHAQLQLEKRGVAVPVLTSYCPTVGEVLPEMGVKPVPLDPQAMLWGFLGGMLAPDLRTDLGTRKRAVCAAIMGAHHGLRMGGDGSQHIGASVAFLLRLSQAALWGEARHAEHKGLSRDQVYKAVLDDWQKGRAQLGEKVTLFHTYHWSHSIGGPKWAAIGHATIGLDKAVLDLIRDPSTKSAVAIVETLNNLINLCHNNAWFLDKFIESSMWNLAADLDPRVALLAGPAWYQATLVPFDRRTELLAKIEAMKPVTVAYKAPKGKVIEAGGIPSHVNMGSAAAHKAGGAPLKNKAGLSKVASGIDVVFGEAMPISQYGTPVKAQAILMGMSAHVQIQMSATTYVTVDVAPIPAAVQAVIVAQPTASSMAGTGTPYRVLAIDAALKSIALVGKWA